MQQVFTCPRCGTPCYMNQRFCGGCGTPVSTSCPYCGMYLSSSSGFCPNCGSQLGRGTKQPVKESKPTSGWAKFGTALFVLGVLVIVLGPIVIMLRPEAEQSTKLLIGCIAVGAFGVAVGLPLMFRR